MPDLDTAEYRKLALIAAGVPLNKIPPIIDTATWRRMLIAALVKNAANQVISGSVDYFSQLPTTIGSPAIGATWLVTKSSGIFYINYRSAGVYMKVTDTGSASDWVYIPMSALGTLPDVTLTNQQVGDTLTWNGTRWINSDSINKLINPIEPTLLDLDRNAGAAQVVTSGNMFTVFSTESLIQSQLFTDGAALVRNHERFYPTDLVYQGGPKWDWTKKIFFTFPINLNQGSAVDGFIRVGIGESSQPWCTNFTGWQIAGGDRKLIFGRGFAADFDSITLKARLTWRNPDNTSSYIESANGIVGSDSIDFFTMVHTPGKLQLYRTMSRELLLTANTGFTSFDPLAQYQFRVGCYTPTATSIFGYPSNPKIRISNMNY
jgi:hypothetical protein